MVIMKFTKTIANIYRLTQTEKIWVNIPTVNQRLLKLRKRILNLMAAKPAARIATQVKPWAFDFKKG
jgi:hypothetical protein